ncbi:MAG: hypothetical protein K2H22_01335, partial [Muribaculaceae bacterium]|nr:hypothetical protein [Muribaculaceae bacterium]
IKHFATAAFITMFFLPTNAVTDLRNSIIPDNVAGVDPQPDSRVNLGFNANPHGLQHISFTFKNDIAVNPDCKGTACIYLDGNDTPIQTVGISGVSIDHMQGKTGQLTFPNTCTSNGTYRVTIPEGFWIIESGGTRYSGAMELNYEILVPQRIWPKVQVTKELSEFRLEFPDFQEANLLDPTKIELFRNTSADTYPLTVTVGKNEDGTKANYIRITLNEAVTEQGDYSLFVQEGAAEGIKHDGGNTTAEPNIETVYTYTISKIDTPEIVPTEGEIDSFIPFELTIPGTPEFWFVDDRAVSFIYPVDADGSLLPDATYRLTARKISDSDKIELTIIENGEPSTSLRPKTGSYALKLAPGLFSGSWNGEFINSAPFIYYYQVMETPEGVKTTPIDGKQDGLQGIYTIDGRKIKRTDETNSMKFLPEGIYIIDGHKKYIKK